MQKYCLLVFTLLLFAQVASGGLQPDFQFPPETIVAPSTVGYSIVINIPQMQLYLFTNGTLRKKYSIAVGKRDTPTPLGRVKIVNKMVNPTWYPKGRNPVPSGPDNPLGERWLGLSLSGYGIHGNNRTSSIGTAISLGCIRMHNPEVEELFKIVPLGTTVDLVYETVILQKKTTELTVSFVADIYRRKPHKQTLEKILAGLPVSRIALPLIMKEGGPVPWQLQVELPSSTCEGFYWNGNAYLPLSPFIEAFAWQREGVEVLLPDGKVVFVDVVAGGELYLAGERLRELLAGIPNLLWSEEGLTIKIDWQEGETPPAPLCD